MVSSDSAGLSANVPQSAQGSSASRLAQLPATPAGWLAVAVAAVYIAFVLMMARVPLGLPTWLDFTLGIVPGVAAAILVGRVIVRSKERSWLVWLAAIGLIPALGQWLIFLGMASL